METFYGLRSRHVVPGFRSFADTAALGELGSASLTPPNLPPFELGNVLRAWEEEASLVRAGELLSAVVTSGLRPTQARKAAEMVLTYESDVPPPVVAVARGLLDNAPAADAERLPRLSTFLESHSKDQVHQRIHRLRSSMAGFPGNAIGYVELARLYSIIGLAARAQHCMEIALGLAPTSRFVLRSAARLLAHSGEKERAYDLLCRSPRTPHDPWLLSAELALAGLVDRETHFAKRAMAAVSSGNLSPLSVTELSSGLATVELFAGRRRRSRDLFKSALVHPNENSLAQVEWAFSNDRLFDVDIHSFNVCRNHEALALEAYERQEWQEVIGHCESWFMDMPFAKRAVMMASHVATVVLEDYEVAEAFCQAGLVAHPLNAQLLNNYAYAVALAGRPEEALSILRDAPLGGIGELTTRVCLLATTGLALFRVGRYQEGRRLYQDAIEEATGIPNSSYHQIAIVNYAREEILANEGLADGAVERVLRIRVEPRAATLAILRDRVLALYRSSTGRPPTG